MNTEISLKDSVDSEDQFQFYKYNPMIKDTKITFRDPDTHEIIWQGKNKTIQPGGGFIARSLFDVSNSIVTPAYNDSMALELDNTVSTSRPQIVQSGPDDTITGVNKICLFCVGTDGCGRENSQVYEVDYRKWIYPENLVPFQYVETVQDTSVMTAAKRKIYFGRKTLPGYYAYYFKAFDAKPVLTEQWADGTPIANTMYTLAKSTSAPVETFVTVQMSITKDDCRDFFINGKNTTINDARINTISLCTAWPKTISGYTYYQDIRPVTKLNFPNEALIDLRKGIDITYQIYF